MHSFLRAIGFSNLKKRKEINEIIQEIIDKPDKKMILEDSNGNLLAELSKDFGEFIGIAVRGEFIEDDRFSPDYYYPYFQGNGVSTEEKIDIERHAEKESYAGICDEVRIGVTLIFYLQNMIEYLSKEENKKENEFFITTTLSALSNFGKILLPIQKKEDEIKNNDLSAKNRNHLIAAAREGDEDAIESLTLEDIDTYSMLSRRIVNEDIFSIVNSYFMPYGIESDQYSILGEILESNVVINSKSKEEMYVLKINSNDLIFDVCINKKDLLGEPEIGRRFKGIIWMQGNLNYSN